MTAMKDIPLKQFCEEHTQNDAAEIIGCTQGAISQMLKASREVFITLDETGRHDWYEIKRNRTRPAA